MSAPSSSVDLLDLKLMPAWVNEPTRSDEYADYTGDEGQPREGRGRGPQQRDRGPRPPRRDQRDQRDRPKRPEQRGRPGERPTGDRAARPPRRDHGPRRDDRPEREAPMPLPNVGVRFLPNRAAFESVIAQIKSGPVTYSVFALARMFLDKPERYEVQLTGSAETPLFQVGEGGPVAVDKRILEGSAFPAKKDDFYTVEVTQTEPIKGNFTNVARDRVSGVLLGPTNHHAYQPQLRNLYEQRYSRRMSFQDFQRQIEIVSDPAVVEQWKEQARSITTYSTKGEETPTTFNNVADAERHFRQTHLPTLLREANELTISGVISRRLPDRGLGRVIENAWSAEMRSPSKMMQELASGLRAAGLNIFRHRKGMLFVSPMRIRTFGHERASVSVSINRILEKLTDSGGVNRKALAEKLVEGITEQTEIDRVKLSIASDLRWLISEGYVIEFNDGTLELPRAKAPAKATEASATAAPAATEESPTPLAEADAAEQMVDALAAPAEEHGGMQVDQTITSEASAETNEPAQAAPADEQSEVPAEEVPSPS
ncbi:MAG: hypothetical protein ACJ8HQ_07740 [Chthoniobacterales bacterium]